MRFSIICPTVFLFLSSCSTIATNAPLASSDWQVNRILVGDSVIVIEGDEYPTLSFTSDTTFAGQTMCNSIGGIYHTTHSGGLSMSIESITTTFCPENTIEGFLIEYIGQTHYFSKTNRGELLLKDADGRTLVELSSVGH